MTKPQIRSTVPFPELTDEERTQLKLWIALGLPLEYKNPGDKWKRANTPGSWLAERYWLRSQCYFRIPDAD